MAYSEVADLLLGNIPLPPNDKARRAVERAADEIDGFLGTKFQVPIRPVGPQQRQVLSLMLTINNWLASGRLIEELTASSQLVEIHAYAQNLIRQALDVINSILRGDILLPGVPPPDGDTTVVETGPIIVNQDAESQTNFYYNSIDNPLLRVQNPGLYPIPVWPYVGGG